MINKIMGSDMTHENGNLLVDDTDFKVLKEREMDSFWQRRQANARLFLLIGGLLKTISFFALKDFPNIDFPILHLIIVYLYGIHSLFSVLLCLASYKYTFLMRYIILNIIIS